MREKTSPRDERLSDGETGTLDGSGLVELSEQSLCQKYLSFRSVRKSRGKYRTLKTLGDPIVNRGMSKTSIVTGRRLREPFLLFGIHPDSLRSFVVVVYSVFEQCLEERSGKFLPLNG